LQRIFPWRACPIGQKKPCFWQQLGRCCGPCTLSSDTAKQLPRFRLQVAKNCQNNVRVVLKILRGGKNRVIVDLKKEMKKASRAKSFEAAAKIRDKIYSLERVLANAKVLGNQLQAQADWERAEKILQKIFKIKNNISRIEAYDISNIQGKEATGSMVTFIKSVPDKNLYRKFRIRIAGKSNDVAMIKELLSRRFNHPDWGLPDLILIDGGRAQLKAAKSAMK
jgi:excinuclease ABC subunit C